MMIMMITGLVRLLKRDNPVSENSKLYLTYRYEIQEILNVDDDVTSPTILDAEGKETLSSITAEWIRNTTDYYQDPSRGGITKLSVEFAGIGWDPEFHQTDCRTSSLLSHVLEYCFSSVHGAIGYIASTNGDDVPLGEKFFLGGIRTIRGFKTREVGA